MAEKFHGLIVSDLADDRVIACRKATYVALDVPTWTQAEALVTSLGESVDGYKVGLELFFGDGARTLQALAGLQKRVFLDVKLHDIPNTVAGALKAICVYPNIEMVNVHASGGERMLVAARDALPATGGAGARPLLVAVTVLTSLDRNDFLALGLPDGPAEAVARLAGLASRCGLDGVVASAQEIESIRSCVPAAFEIVVPGTRPVGADMHDQRRSLTPGEAFARGASRLVLGRAVTGEPNPRAALAGIWQEMWEALQSTKGDA